MPLTEEQKKRLRELQGQSRESRLAPSSVTPPAIDEQVAAPERGRASRLFGVLTSGREFLEASGALGLIPGVDEFEDLSPGFLPDIAERAIDTGIDWTVNPVGIASLAFAPALPAARLARFVPAGVKASRLAQSTVARGAAEIGARVGSDVVVGAAATGAGRAVDAALPEGTPPLVRAGLTLGAGLAGATTAGAAISRAIPRTAAEEASRRASSVRVVDKTGEVKQRRVIQELPSVEREMANVESAGKLSRVAGLVNPSAKYSDTLHRMTTGYERARLQASNQINAVLGGAFPKGLRSFNIADDGTMLIGGQRHQWHEAIKMVDKLTPDQAGELAQMRAVLDDVTDILADYGYKVPDEFLDPDYIPRQVLSKQGVELPRRSDPFSERLWRNVDEAAKGGIVYAGPADTMRLHLKTAFDMVLEKQMEDALDAASIPVSVAVLSTKRGNDAYTNWRRAANEVGAARKAKDAAQAAMTAELERRGVVSEDAMSALIAAQKKLRAAREVAESRRANWKKVHTEVTDNLRRGTVEITGGELPTRIDPKYARRVEELRGTKPTVFGKRVFANDDSLKRYQQWLAEKNILPKKPNAALHVFAEGSNLARTASATLDFAMPFVQGLPLLFRDPVAWSKMAVSHYVSTFSPGYQSRYIRENLDTIQEMVVKGSVPIGDVEYFTSLQHGLTRSALDAPILNRTLRPTFNAFQRGYDTGLLVMRTEMWKSMKGQMDDKSLGQFIRNASGGLETKGLGVSPNQRDVESLLFFAPKFLRSSLALVGDAARPWSPEGAEAAHTLMRMMAGAAGLFVIGNVAAGVANGDTEEEIRRRVSDSLNPTKGREFLAVQVDDRWYGIGGTVRSVSQMLAQTVAAGVEGNIDEIDNPLAKFLQGRTAPGVRFATALTEKVTGESLNLLPYETIDSWPELTTFTGTSFLPFAVQGMVEEGGITPNALLDVTGINPKPLSPIDVLNQQAYETYGIKWSDLTDEEQAAIKSRQPEIVAEGERFGSRSERDWRATRDSIDERTRTSLVGLNEALAQGRISPDDFRARVEETVRDRWVSQNQAREDFGIEFGPANTTKRLVTDAYFQTFEDAEIVPNQTDWDVWEEKQAELQRRIQSGEFGNVARAQEFLEERKHFEYPPELAWYGEAKDTISQYNYWGIKDEVFAFFGNTIQSLVPEAATSSDLEVLKARATVDEDHGLGARVDAALRIIDREVSRRRKLLRIQHPDLQRALLLTGRVESAPRF